MPVALVTGANRGVGLAHVRRFIARKWRVIAAARDPNGASELAQAVYAADARVVRYDAADPGAAEALAAEIGAEPIDVLLNNAGVMGGAGGLESVSAEDMSAVFAINTVAPLLLSRALADAVARSQRKTIVMQSSTMGAIGEASGGYYAYRASKAALNMVAKALSNDLRARGIIVVAMHPGWVRTRMGGPGATIDADQSAAGAQAFLDRVSLEQSGGFFRYDGGALSW